MRAARDRSAGASTDMATSCRARRTAWLHAEANRDGCRTGPPYFVAGRAIRPVERAAGRYAFMLPAGTRRVTLSSRATQPADIDRHLDDRRRLGVAVASIMLRGDGNFVVLPADHLPAGDGWHAAETVAGRCWRWTNGAGQLNLDPLPEAAIMEIGLGGSINYVVKESPARLV